MKPRSSLLLLPLLAAAVLLTGCISITSVGTSQPQSMGPVRLTVRACASGSPGCPASPSGRSAYNALVEFRVDDPLPLQPLVAIRLPLGATPPESVTAQTSGGTIAFARSMSYESELETFEPAPAGERWWGWLGRAVDYGTRGPQSFSFTVEVSLPRPADGGPLPSPMRWRPVVGGRPAFGRLSPERPVDCGTTAAQFYGGWSESGTVGEDTVCVSYPNAAETRGFLDAPIVDFGLTGATVTASAGSTTTATLVATRTGLPDPATTFSLAVSGGPAGAAITLDRSTVSLREATTPVTATIAVPAGTAPGSYPITVTATAPGKPARSAVATLVVPVPPEQPRDPGTPRGPMIPDDSRLQPTPPRLPTLTARLSPARFAAGRAVARARRGRAAVGTTVRITLSEPADVMLTAQRITKGRAVKGRCLARARRGRRCTSRGRTVVVGSYGLAAGAQTIRFAGTVRGRRLAAGSYGLVLVATDATGQRSTPLTLSATVLRAR